MELQQEVDQYIQDLKAFLKNEQFNGVEKVLESLFVFREDPKRLNSVFQPIFRLYHNSSNAERVLVLRAMINALNKFYPERQKSVPPLPDLNHLEGMPKLRQLFVHYFTLMNPGTLEEKLIMLDVLLAKSKLNIPIRYNGKVFNGSFDSINVFDDGSPPHKVPYTVPPPRRVYMCDFSQLNLSALYIDRDSKRWGMPIFKSVQCQDSNLMLTTMKNVVIADMHVQGATLTGLVKEEAKIHFHVDDVEANKDQELVVEDCEPQVLPLHKY